MMDEEEFPDLGSLEVTASDGTGSFARLSAIREASKKAFMKLDCSSKVARAVLRKAAPLPGNYDQGDLVCYRRRPRIGEQGTQWSTACKIIGKEGNKAIWLLHETVPVCVPVDKLRPCTSAEALAYQYLSKNNHQDEIGETLQGQQGFIDIRQNSDDRQITIIEENDEIEEVSSEEEWGDNNQALPEVPLDEAEEPEADVQPALQDDQISNDNPDDQNMTSEDPIIRRRTLLDDLPRSVRQRISSQVSGTSTEPEAESGLLSAWRRSGEDRGVEMLSRRQSEGYSSFIACRFTNYANYKPKSDVMGRNLEFDKADEATKDGIRAARRKEWDKWCKFHAVVPVHGKELDDLLKEGHRVIPTRWVDTDKAFFKRQEGGPYVPPEFKSRLVTRGDLEKEKDLRTDSPTCDLVAMRLILSYAACNKLRICSGDIANAYFQGKEIDRLFLLKPPRDDTGLEGVPEGAALICRVPIYGQTDAGRGLWLKIKQIMQEIGWKASTIYPALYYVEEHGEIKAILGTHVDDMLWAVTPGYELYVDKLLQAFDVGKVENTSFRFCGLEVEQDADFSITATARDNTSKIKPVSYPEKAPTTSAATPGEVEQLRSVIGSLSWIARQVRPDLSYRTSRLQSSINDVKRYHLKEANKVVEQAVTNFKCGLHFKSGLFQFRTSHLITMTDASWAGDTEIVNNIPQAHRSQAARLVLLAGPEAMTGIEIDFHPIAYGSTLIRRQCRSTLHAETQSLQQGVEESWKIRAALAEMHGISLKPDWQSASAESRKNVWLTDCRSLSDHLTSPTLGKVTDKRLAIDLSSLRQDLWDSKGEPVDALSDELCHDKIRWIDTSTMLVDCLTKAMTSHELMIAIMPFFTSSIRSVQVKEGEKESSEESKDI